MIQTRRAKRGLRNVHLVVSFDHSFFFLQRRKRGELDEGYATVASSWRCGVSSCSWRAKTNAASAKETAVEVVLPDMHLFLTVDLDFLTFTLLARREGLEITACTANQQRDIC